MAYARRARWSAPAASFSWCARAIAVVWCAGAIACGTATADGDDDGVPLPDRTTAAPAGDAGTDAPAPPPRPEAGTDAAGDAPLPSTTCDVPDLVLCFAFDGALVDGSPNAMKPSAATGVSFESGKEGQAGTFGATSALRFGPSPLFEVTTATVEAWVKRAPSPPGDGVIFDDDGRFSLTILVDGSVLCKASGAPLSAGNVAVGQWTHVACVADGARVHLYVGGAELASNAGTIPSSPAAGAAIGGNAPSGEPFVGAIDSFRVFHVARSTAQIAAAAGK